VRTRLAAALVALTACRAGSKVETAGPGADPQLARAVIRHYADLAHAGYQDALTAARALEAAVTALVERPSALRLDQARAAWRAARPAYLQTEVLRFYGGPIDAIEIQVNAWPIDESYVDALVAAPEPATLTAASLLALNEQGGETNVSVGYHAIEYLLWGPDRYPDSPGQRPHTDYLPGAPHAARRGAYLQQATGLLVRHLSQLVAAWEPGPRPPPAADPAAAPYRAGFLALPVPEALRRILAGMGTLSGPELAGERLTVAYETKDQEDEHSCFSDNTHEDLVHDVLGIQNVYLGRYLAADGRLREGPGLQALLALADSALAARLAATIDSALQAVRAIPVPFDRAMAGPDSAPGRQAIKRAIRALRALSDGLAEAAAALRVPLNL
jgi:putative iron-regulated protein